MSTYKRNFGIIFLFLLAGSCAFILMWWTTEHGPGVSPDSTVYIEAAQTLLSGKGFLMYGKPMTHYPPGYPFLIAVADLLYPGDVLQAARFLAALFYCINLILLGLMVYISTKRSLVATSCAMLLFLFSAPTISVHSMAWSEAPFIMFSTASFILFSYHIARPRTYVLVLASFMAAFAATTRYVGVVLFPTIALALFLLEKRDIKLKIRDIIIFTIVASIPLALWLIRNILIAQTATNREFSIHLVGFGHVKSFLYTMYNSFIPISILPKIKMVRIASAVVFFALATVFFLGGGSIIYRKADRKQNPTSMAMVLPLLCAIYYVIYVVFLFIHISLLDANTPLNNRILLPAILALIPVSVALAWSLSEKLGRRWIRYGFILLVLFSVSVNANPAIKTAMDIHNNGRGYTSRYWNNSEIIAYLSISHEARTIYSNGTDAIRFLTKKEAVWIPPKVFPNTLRANQDYEKELNQMIHKCIEGKALIVYFNSITWRWYLPTTQEIESSGNLPVIIKTQEGVIYGKR